MCNTLYSMKEPRLSNTHAVTDCDLQTKSGLEKVLDSLIEKEEEKAIAKAILELLCEELKGENDRESDMLNKMRGIYE